METEAWRYLMSALALIGTAVYHRGAYRFSVSFLEDFDPGEKEKTPDFGEPAAEGMRIARGEPAAERVQAVRGEPAAERLQTVRGEPAAERAQAARRKSPAGERRAPGGGKAGFYGSLAVSLALTGAVLFSDLPMLILFLIIYLLILLEYMFLFKGRLVTFVFTSGSFMFHIMNIHLMFYGIFAMFFKIRSMGEFRNSGLFPLLIFVVLLVLNVFLELYVRMVDQEVLQLLLKNIGQLYFVTMSHAIINLYLCMLGVCYSLSYMSSLMSLFFLCTSILLFGAFYTAFNHAVRTSVLMGYEAKSRNLERQLVKSSEDISQLKSYVYLDPLTGVPNRRYGLEKLNRLLEEKARFTIGFIDLDRLKYVNDVFGHSEGDKYILCVVKSLIRVFGGAALCRMGGDEFMLLLPGKEKRVAEELMPEADQKIRETAAQLKFGFEPSVSCGILEIEEDTIFGASEILDMADRKMYEQKQEKKRQRGR